jgi:hypothetical protein
MTKNDLLNAIRVIVQEEVREQLPNILIEILSEKTGTDRSVVSERAQAPKVQPTVRSAPKTVEPKKYSSNPTLNAILNETVGGVPPEDAASVGVSIPKEVLTENSALAGVANAMNRDYRQLLKATDKKAKASRGGALNFQMSAPTNFDQEG